MYCIGNGCHCHIRGIAQRLEFTESVLNGLFLVQSNGMGGDIFGAHPAGSPGLISMASPVKPQQTGQYGMQGGSLHPSAFDHAVPFLQRCRVQREGLNSLE